MKLTGTIPDLHICPGCGDELASGIGLDGSPRRCGRCEKAEAVPARYIYIPIEQLADYERAPEGMNASGVMVGLVFCLLCAATGCAAVYGLVWLWRAL